jgi:hypothetical protein
MPVPTDTALRARARGLIEAMTERARWIYAVPREMGDAHAGPILQACGLVCADRDEAAKVERYASDSGDASVVTFSSAELDVMLVEATGAEAPPVLRRLLDKTGFYAQSELLRTALDVHHPEVSLALKTLAHMVVAWDEDWSDLFLLHLASPDPVARHAAVLAVGVAVLVAREPGPALGLLEEARRRERYPKLRETMGEAIQMIQAATGGPVTVKPEG